MFNLTIAVREVSYETQGALQEQQWMGVGNQLPANSRIELQFYAKKQKDIIFLNNLREMYLQFRNIKINGCTINITEKAL